LLVQVKSEPCATPPAAKLAADAADAADAEGGAEDEEPRHRMEVQL
jgi:hypothetical protein